MTLLTVSPLAPGSVSNNSKHEAQRDVDIKGAAPVQPFAAFLTNRQKAFLAISCGDVHLKLLVGGHIHEDKVIVLTIQKLHVAGFEVGLADFFAGTEGYILHAASKDIAQLGTNQSATLAGLEMLKINDFVRGAFDFDLQTLAKVCGRIHLSS